MTKKSNDPYDQVMHESWKKRPNEELIKTQAFEYFDKFDSNESLSEIHLAEVVASLARSYYRSGKCLEARVCIKLLSDRLKDQEYDEDAFQFFILRLLYEDLGDFENLIIFCQEMIFKVEAYYAREAVKAGDSVTRFYCDADELPTEIPTIQLIQEDLDKERGYLYRWIEKGKSALSEAINCEVMLRSLPAFGGAWSD
jgi:tetratricopeptide (TPR) repeat protein